MAFALALAVAALEVLAMPFGRAFLLVVVRVVDALRRHGSLPQLAVQCWDRAHRHRCSAQRSGHRRLSLLDQFHLRIDGIQFLGGFVKVLRVDQLGLVSRHQRQGGSAESEVPEGARWQRVLL